MAKRSCSRGHRELPQNGVCPICLQIAAEEHEPFDLAPVPLGVYIVDDGGATFHPGKEEAG